MVCAPKPAVGVSVGAIVEGPFDDSLPVSEGAIVVSMSISEGAVVVIICASVGRFSVVLLPRAVGGSEEWVGVSVIAAESAVGGVSEASVGVSVIVSAGAFCVS